MASVLPGISTPREYAHWMVDHIFAAAEGTGRAVEIGVYKGAALMEGKRRQEMRPDGSEFFFLKLTAMPMERD